MPLTDVRALPMLVVEAITDVRASPMFVLEQITDVRALSSLVVKQIMDVRALPTLVVEAITDVKGFAYFECSNSKHLCMGFLGSFCFVLLLITSCAGKNTKNHRFSAVKGLIRK